MTVRPQAAFGAVLLVQQDVDAVQDVDASLLLPGRTESLSPPSTGTTCFSWSSEISVWEERRPLEAVGVLALGSVDSDTSIVLNVDDAGAVGPSKSRCEGLGLRSEGRKGADIKEGENGETHGGWTRDEAEGTSFSQRVWHTERDVRVERC